MNQELKNKILKLGFFKTMIHDSRFMIRSRLPTTNYPLPTHKGFTLIEALVSMSIFAIMTLVVIDVFSRSQVIQIKAAALQKLQDDSRFIINKLATEIRNGNIAYDYYTASTQVIDSNFGNDTLVLKNKDGEFISIKSGTTEVDCGSLKNTPCVLLRKTNDISGSEAWSRMSSNDIQVPTLKFYIMPDKNPFEFNADGITYQSNEQPRVRIVLSEKSTVSRKQDTATVSIQTLVSTREYRR